MKVSLNWLKDYITAGISADALAQKLTMAGLEVERIQTVEGDRVFELEITPNRVDCLNMVGISRELSAILNKPRKAPKIKRIKFPRKKCDIRIDAPKGCARYIGTLIEGVQVAKTPEWMLKRLNAIGMRGVNNIVDISNFCLMEMGQPLHAFDYDKLEGGKIIVRWAKKGEKIVTIDGDNVSLDPSILVIADAKRPVAIAGVMGGKETEVSNKTMNILLESAYFDPVAIRLASRKVGISTDSSYRFERDVDFQTVETGSNRAINLILEMAKGEITGHSDTIARKPKSSREKIRVSVKGVNNFLGADLAQSQYTNILKKLDFQVKAKKDILRVTPPEFRGDISRDVDVIEEISRIVGYDNLPSTLPQIRASNIPLSEQRIKRGALRERLTAQGFSEVITYSMINQEALEKSSQGELSGIEIVNPLTQDQEMMRPSMLPSLLSVVRNNLNHNQRDLKLFEIGKIYHSKKEGEALGLIMFGSPSFDWRRTDNVAADYYDLCGAVDRALSAVGGHGLAPEARDFAFFEKGASASINVGGKNLGFLGKIDEEVLNNWDIKQDNVYFAQIDLEPLFHLPARWRKFVPLDEYPSIIRDVSISVKKETTYAQVQHVIGECKIGLLRDVWFQEQYLGEKISRDQRGLIFSCVYQSAERTLREEEVNEAHQLILQALTEKLQAVIR